VSEVDMVDKETVEEPIDFFIYIVGGLILIAILFVIWFFYIMRGSLLPLS